MDTVKRKEVIYITQSNGNGRGSADQNGKQNQSNPSVKYEHLQRDTWVKQDEDGLSLLDSQSVRDQIEEEDEDDQSDDRN